MKILKLYVIFIALAFCNNVMAAEDSRFRITNDGAIAANVNFISDAYKISFRTDYVLDASLSNPEQCPPRTQVVYLYDQIEIKNIQGGGSACIYKLQKINMFAKSKKRASGKGIEFTVTPSVEIQVVEDGPSTISLYCKNQKMKSFGGRTILVGDCGANGPPKQIGVSGTIYVFESLDN